MTARSILLRLLVALLIVQGVAAPAWCLERMAFGTPICTADGSRIQHDGGDALHHGQDGCVVCHALPQGPVPEGPALAAPGVALAAAERPWPVAGGLPDGRRARAYAARAPPAA